MKIKILRSTVASGVRVEAGKTVDVSDVDARLLVGMGKAEKVEKEEKPEKAAGK